MTAARMSFVLLMTLTVSYPVLGDQIVVSPRMHHLRGTNEREWADFPAVAEATELRLSFDAKANSRLAALRLRQQDIKQKWQVRLNDVVLGELRIDENDMIVYFDVPAGTVRDGANELVVAQRGNKSDDVRVGEIVIDGRRVSQVLNEAEVTIAIEDVDTSEPLPCRITILNEDGALQTPGVESNEHLAVRPGIVYTSTGKATFGLPAGNYEVIVGRGFEYSIAKASFAVAVGGTIRRELAIRREVPTSGYVACDTHVHTRTHSGHGDATVQERMITLAAEGIELPIATDHNVHIDHEPFAREMQVRDYFTPVVGNEVTTRTGHFNIFPVVAGSKTPDHRSSDWKQTLDGIFKTPNVKVAILNHARDVHGGTTPFGARLFNDAVGENVADWHMGFNAMEVINSGATQTDVMQLFHDWMALLNRGYLITPVGSSDSHDVGRHFVGQGRTYIRCDDRDPGNIDVNRAVTSFVAGNVIVSYGLITEMTVDNRYTSGDIAKSDSDPLSVRLRVLGPHWVNADKVMLFANGQLIRQQKIDNRSRTQLGVIWSDDWELPKPNHDMHLVAIAVGPGIDSLHWRTAKPYQPDSPDPTTHVIGCSSAIWIDADGDGKATSARGYAERLFAESKGDVAVLLDKLGGYDAAVAAQAANLLQQSGTSLLGESVTKAVNAAKPQVQDGFERFIEAWRRCQLSKVAP